MWKGVVSGFRFLEVILLILGALGFRPFWAGTRPTDLIERVAKTDSEDPNLAPLYENAIRDTMERFEAAGSVDPILRPRKKCATVRSNPARIGAGARETVNS